MKVLSQEEKEEYLEKHLRHRLTLLRTFRHRIQSGYNFTGQGDIYRCLKDANLIAVRLLMDFLGLKGKKNNSGYLLEMNKRKYENDIKLDQFTGELINLQTIPTEVKVTLAGVYVRGDKELAHLTTQFDEYYNKPEKLIEAASIVEGLIDQYLYMPLGKKLPELDL